MRTASEMEETMKKGKIRRIIGGFIMASALLTGCGNDSAQQGQVASDTLVSQNTSTPERSTTEAALTGQETEQTISNIASSETSNTEEMVLEMKFGYEGKTIYRIQLYDNVTAQELYRDIGESNYNLPIYHFDDFDQADVIQYYDLPSRYHYTVENAQEVDEVKAGELYYSDPNRIILVYRDTTLEGEYVPIGKIDVTDPENFAKEVEDSAVLDYWDCKVVPIHRVGVAFDR